MGRKKYYCDFCNRYFNDDRNTRYKHLNSVAHINLKKEHYSMFRDLETILNEESAKKTCRKFHLEGFCPFGGSCTFSHYSKDDLDSIRQELFRKNYKNKFGEQTLESWLLKYNQDIEKERQKSRKLLWSNELPSEILNSQIPLPPSMMPYPIKEFLDADLDSWG